MSLPIPLGGLGLPNTGGPDLEVTPESKDGFHVLDDASDEIDNGDKLDVEHDVSGKAENESGHVNEHGEDGATMSIDDGATMSVNEDGAMMSIGHISLVLKGEDTDAESISDDTGDVEHLTDEDKHAKDDAKSHCDQVSDTTDVHEHEDETWPKDGYESIISHHNEEDNALTITGESRPATPLTTPSEEVEEEEEEVDMVKLQIWDGSKFVELDLKTNLAHRPGLPSPGPCTIFSNDLIEIRRSPLGGYGAFARTDIHKGDVVLVEKALMVSSKNDVESNEKKLSEGDRQIFQSLATHERLGIKQEYRSSQTFDTNNFLIPGGGNALFAVASRFNHKCTGACSIDWSITNLDDKGVFILMFANRVIPADQELTISYGPPTKEYLYIEYGIRCECGSCTTLTAEEAKDLDNSIWRENRRKEAKKLDKSIWAKYYRIED